MTAKEAIKMLRTIKRTVFLGNLKFVHALDVAIEALEKQMPKKAELCYEDLICPVCGSDVEWKRYCEECGQRIDTGDES